MAWCAPLAAVVLVVGCSSSSSTASKATTPPSRAASAAATTTGPAAASTTAPSPQLAAVSGDVLKQADLPAGWQAAASPADQSSGTDQSTQQLQTCLGLPPDSANNSPNANSDDFGLPVAGGGVQTISNSISVGAAVAPELAQFVALQGPKAAGCVNQLLTAVLQQQITSSAPGATLNGVTTAAVNVGSYLDRTVAFQTTATVTAANLSGQQTTRASIDLVLFQRGRYTAEFEFAAAKVAIDPAVQKQARRGGQDELTPTQLMRFPPGKRARPLDRRAGVRHISRTTPLAVVVAFLLLVAGCAPSKPAAGGAPGAGVFSAGPCPPSPPGVPTAVTAPSAASTGLRCGTISVPLRHEQPSGARIALAVAVLATTAKQPDGPPVIMLAGGPGEALVEDATALSSAGPASPLIAIRAERDLVLLDQRGVGASVPALTCTEDVAALQTLPDALPLQPSRTPSSMPTDVVAPAWPPAPTSPPSAPMRDHGQHHRPHRHHHSSPANALKRYPPNGHRTIAPGL